MKVDIYRAGTRHGASLIVNKARGGGCCYPHLADEKIEACPWLWSCEAQSGTSPGHQTQRPKRMTTEYYPFQPARSCGPQDTQEAGEWKQNHFSSPLRFHNQTGRVSQHNGLLPVGEKERKQEKI